MKWLVSLFAFFFLNAPLAAQTLPTPGFENPRLQTVRYEEGQQVELTALPQTALTVVLEPSEEITRIIAGDRQSYDVRVSSERNSFQLTSRRNARDMELQVETNLRRYDFTVTVGEDLMAAYIVRFEYGPISPPPIEEEVADIEELGPQEIWRYRLRGSKLVRPLDVSDDGDKTRIRYSEGQALPAVFAIGPTGKEELVNGYMRDGIYVIDRVYQELVFRIDKKKARAQRHKEPEVSS